MIDPNEARPQAVLFSCLSQTSVWQTHHLWYSLFLYSILTPSTHNGEDLIRSAVCTELLCRVEVGGLLATVGD